MSALRTALGVSSVSIVIAIGCGGSTGSETVGDGGSPVTTTSSSGGSGSGGGTASTSGSSGSGGDDGSAGDDGSPGSPGDDSGLPTVGPDGGIVQPGDDGGGTEPMADGGPGRQTPPPVTDGGLDQTVCGTTTCDSKTDVCCVSTHTCVAANATCRGGDTLTCSGSNSCAGGVCCEEATGRTTYTSKCETKCPANAAQLCTTNADCTSPDICRVAGADYGVCGRAPAPPPTPGRDGGVVIVPPRRDGGV